MNPGKKSLSKTAVITALVMMAAIFGSVGAAKLSGFWKTESSKVPATIKAGEFAGEYDPSDIRGSYTFDDVYDAFGVSPEILSRVFVPGAENPGSLKVKDIEAMWSGASSDREIGTDSLRLFVSLWKGLPYSQEENTALPLKAVIILENSGKIDKKKAEELRANTVELPEMDNQEISDITQNAEDSDFRVKGITTFGELGEWGVTEDQWKDITGLPMGSSIMTIKDWAEKNSVSVSEFRNSVQDLVDLNHETSK